MSRQEAEETGALQDANHVNVSSVVSALWLTGAGATCIRGASGAGTCLQGYEYTTEAADVLEGCTSRKSSFRNISEIKTVMELYALSQFTTVNELLGQIA